MEADTSRSARQALAKRKTRVVKVLNWGDNPPLVVCLCGSMKYRSDFMSAARAFTLQGHVVVMPGVFSAADGGFIDGETRKKLDELQLRKIEMADIICVVNPRGQLDETVRREIEYAESLGKVVRYLAA